MIRSYLTTFCLVIATILTGCRSERAGSPSPPPVATQDEHGHSHDDGDDHEHGEANGGGHGDEGPLMELGKTTAGTWSVSASRSEAALKPGGETVVECEVSGGSEAISAVRCWIGTKDAKGAIKALAEGGNAADPAHRHVHIEVPNPIPSDSQLWIEVEDGSGKHLAGFDLKQ